MWRATGTETEWRRQVGFVGGLVVCGVISVWVADCFCRGVDERCTRFARRLEERWKDGVV